jgi:hypothetical protein
MRKENTLDRTFWKSVTVAAGPFTEPTFQLPSATRLTV